MTTPINPYAEDHLNIHCELFKHLKSYIPKASGMLPEVTLTTEGTSDKTFVTATLIVDGLPFKVECTLNNSDFFKLI